MVPAERGARQFIQSAVTQQPRSIDRSSSLHVHQEFNSGPGAPTSIQAVIYQEDLTSSAMTSETAAEQAREHLYSEFLHQAHLKSLWFIGCPPGSTQSSSEARHFKTLHESPLESELQADSSKKNVERWGSRELHPWRKTRMTPLGHLLGRRDDVPIATIPVQQRHVNHSHDLELHRKRPQVHLDLQVGDGRSHRSWGVKRKIIDASDHRRESNANEPRVDEATESYEVGQLVPFNFLRGQWASPAASSPQAQKLTSLYGSVHACTARGLFPKRSPLVKDPKSSILKAHHSRPPTNMLKLPKDMQGRWSSERYKSAQLKLIDIMHERRAQPGRPILRPALREEARKHVGDTGLLDHLLKHMTDTVVSTGERFRRRHNAEGAMEYWLEDASLMEIRKAAGIEDPSWLPPQGWKPGDKVQGGFNWGMSTSEAAEMNHLKDTVEVLRREMTFLFEKLKELRQMGILQVVDLKDADRTAHDAHVEERQAEQMTTAGSNSLEQQLADVRKEVSRMQSDVQCILKLLGCQHLRVNTSPQTGGMLGGSSLLSTEEVVSATNVSETLNPVCSSRGVVSNAELQEPLTREFASVNSATSSSADAECPTTKPAYRVNEKPDSCPVKMGEICPCPQGTASAVCLNLTATNSVNPAPNSNRWDDYNNPGSQPETTTNSSRYPPGQINFPGVVSKDNCPVAAAMAGMFGCMMQANQHPVNGDNSKKVGMDVAQLRHMMAVNYTAPSERCSIGRGPKVASAITERTLGPTCQAIEALKPNDNSASTHLGPPLSLSLSLGSF